MQTETILLSKERNVSLTTFLQPVGGEFRFVQKRPAVLVLPGGGYQFCSDREAEVIALAYLNAGYHAFVLRYSIKEHSTWPQPLEDYEQAMELIIQNADVWNVYADKIAVIGFSAGGHLASAAATLSRNRPAAALLGYAVTQGATLHAIGPEKPDTCKAVSADTCPCFIFATRDDGLVPIANSVSFMAALAAHDIAFESHIYSHGPHGFSTGTSDIQPAQGMSARVSDWVSDSIGWLREVLGDFSPQGGLTAPSCPRRINGNHEPFLSVDCTMSYLMQHEHGRVVLAQVMEGMKKSSDIPADMLERGASMDDLLAGMPLRMILSMAPLPPGTLEALDAQLREIKN